MYLIEFNTCSILLPPRLLNTPALGPALALAPANTEYDPLPQYSFAYNVQDALTGDHKNHQESRNGDVVKGIFQLCCVAYTLIVTETMAHFIKYLRFI